MSFFTKVGRWADGTHVFKRLLAWQQRRKENIKSAPGACDVLLPNKQPNKYFLLTSGTGVQGLKAERCLSASNNQSCMQCTHAFMQVFTHSVNVYWKLLWARHCGGSSGYKTAIPAPTLQGSIGKWGRQSGDRGWQNKGMAWHNK